MKRTVSELSHERSLAERFALLKVALACATVVVILIDRTIPNQGTPEALGVAGFVASLFLIYQLAAWRAVRRKDVSMDTYRWISPAADVIGATAIIISTDGYLSPFNLWFAISVVSTGFSSSFLLPVATAMLAVAAQVLVASVPQVEPLDYIVFSIRTGFLMAFAFMIASASNHLVKQSQALADLEAYSRDLALANGMEEATEIFKKYLSASLGADDIRVRLKGVAADDDALPISNGEIVIGQFNIDRRRALSAEERQLAILFSDRLAATIRKIELGDELVQAAAREERQKYADELHDTHLQTLAAVDLHAELAVRKTRDPQAVEQLKAIKDTVRSAAIKTRAFIHSVDQQEVNGPDILEATMEERWPGGAVFVHSDARLTEGQWRAVKYLLQEGMNNAKFHGKAKNLMLTVWRRGEVVEAALEADGLSPKSPGRYGYGLQRLETVVLANGGELTLTPGVRGGSRLAAVFPMLEETA